MAKRPPFNEIGETGLKVYAGVIDEEFLQELKGPRGAKTYRQMWDNDATINAIIAAIELLIRSADWKIEPADDSPQAKEAAEFAESILQDMNQPFVDFISEAMSMLVYGWSYFEVVLKRRVGPLETNPKRRSKFSDGKIGVRKLAIRSQDTLDRWELQEDGGISGLHQFPITGMGGTKYIPINRALLFRTTSHKNNPEGRSILRQAYRSWYLMKVVQNAEAIGIERELAGLPVAYIPSDYMSSSADSGQQAFFDKVKQIVRDVKFNEQGGVVLPSDVYEDAEGKPSNVSMVRLELLSTSGRRQIDTNTTIVRYQRDIARSALADFVMLGTDGRGSYALSKDKTDLFLRACGTYLNRLADPINRYLFPRLWDYNGMDYKYLPQAVPGNIAPVDLNELGTYIERLTRAGASLFPDGGLEAHLRDIADFPKPSSTQNI